jgi:4'-phosphopantetheinyl transferase
MKSIFQCRPPGAHSILSWSYHLGTQSLVISELEHCLSREETARAARYYFEKDRAAYIVGRGVVRHLLGAMLDVDPQVIQLGASPTGKPHLTYPDAAIQFNLSHSGQALVWAVAEGQRVGVDIEQMRTVEYVDVARQLFSQDEYSYLVQAPAALQQSAFYKIWTQKEAVVKLFGDGLGANYLTAFSVDPNPTMPPNLITAPFAHLWLAPLNVSPGYQACLAFEQPAEVIRNTL